MEHIDEVPNFEMEGNVQKNKVEYMVNHIAVADALSISSVSEDLFLNSRDDETDGVAGQLDSDASIMDNFIADNFIGTQGMKNGGTGHKLEKNIRVEEDVDSIRIIIEYKKPQHNREDTNLITKFKNSIFSSRGLGKTKSVNESNNRNISIKPEAFDDSGVDDGCFEMAAETSAEAPTQQEQPSSLDDKLNKITLAEQKIAELRDRMNSTKQRLDELEGKG